MSDDVRDKLGWVKFEDYKRADGTIDWGAYWAAQTANGERCDRCGAFLFHVEHMPGTCEQCKQLESDPGVVYHARRIRCPHCSATHRPKSPAGGEVTTRLVICESCGQKYLVEVDVVYSYRSPAKLSADGKGN